MNSDFRKHCVVVVRPFCHLSISHFRCHSRHFGYVLRLLIFFVSHNLLLVLACSLVLQIYFWLLYYQVITESHNVITAALQMDQLGDSICLHSFVTLLPEWVAKYCTSASAARGRGSSPELSPSPFLPRAGLSAELACATD